MGVCFDVSTTESGRGARFRLDILSVSQVIQNWRLLLWKHIGILIPYTGVAGQVAGQASQVSQVVDLLVNQVNRFNKGVGPKVDKMVENKVEK